MTTSEDIILNRFKETIIKNKHKKTIQFTYNYHIENNYKKIKSYKIVKIINESLEDSGISCNENIGVVHISIIQAI